MLQFDSKTITQLEADWTEKLKVFFYGAWCSGTKIDMTTDFEVDDSLTQIESCWRFDLYVEISDREKLENARITKVVKADHTGKEKIRYIYSSDDVLDRCGCGTSFWFEKKIPKIDLSKLKDMKKNFNF